MMLDLEVFSVQVQYCIRRDLDEGWAGCVDPSFLSPDEAAAPAAIMGEQLNKRGSEGETSTDNLLQNP